MRIATISDTHWKYNEINVPECDILLHAGKILEIKPKLHVSGHIHEARGVFVDNENNITYVNASSLNLQYRP